MEDQMISFKIFMLLTTISGILFAQQDTLIKSDDKVNGFGGPVAKFTSIYEQGAIMLGGRGGWIFDHSIVIGGGIYTLANEVDAPPNILPAEGPLDIDFSYFGPEIEYIFQHNSFIHYSLYMFIGIGSIRFLKDEGSFSKDNTQVEENNWVLVLEPAVNLELNVTDWCRVMAGISYNIVSGVTKIGLGNSDFSGITATLTVKLGSF
jgi:hypothetical protein